jgi:tRNA-guanine family transglycosylase
MHVPVAELFSMPGVNVMEKYQGGVHKFTNMEDYSFFFTVRDPVLNDFGPSNQNSYSIEGQHGKKRLTATDFMKSITTFRPDAYGSMSDEVPAWASASRASKSVTRSIQWLDVCLAIHEKDAVSLPEEKRPLVFATVQGGVHESLRVRCAQEMAGRKVDGFVLGGLCCGESSEQRRATITTMLEHLPAHLPRFLPGFLGPVEILDVVQLGVDLVDSPYP